MIRVKKVSLFFSNDVKKRIAQDSPGILRAMRLPAELFEFALVGGFDEDLAKKFGGQYLWKYFYRYCTEFGDLRNAVTRAWRVEGAIGLSRRKGEIEVEIAFYGRGEKRSAFALTFEINLETGNVRGLGVTYTDAII